MADLERIIEISMKIVAFSGMAKSEYMLALQAAKNGDMAGYEERIKNGEGHYSEAHALHKQIVSIELETMEPQSSLLLMHAEDQLMCSETIKFVVGEVAELIQKRSEGDQNA